MLAGRVSAQTFTTLYSFSSSSNGVSPYASLILSGNTLYGTTAYGGSGNSGAVFAINTDGAGYTNLHSFNFLSDGSRPQARLVLSSNVLFGTAVQGGSVGSGTVFAVNTDGSGFTNLHSFTSHYDGTFSTNGDGAYPYGGLILSGNTLYGTTAYNGSGADGTVFAINTDGSSFTNLHYFTIFDEAVENDGGQPRADLILSGNTLYGTAYDGPQAGNGRVFAVNPDGTGFTFLHLFNGSDGIWPEAGLILSGNTLYGTCYKGGISSGGTVFAVNTDGTGFTNLHNFTSHNDGANPQGDLILSGNTLIGTTFKGGVANYGTVFAVNTDGTGFTNLHSFSTVTSGTNSDGRYLRAGLVLKGNTLYGTASVGGSAGNGTIYSLSFAPQLTIVSSGANVILTWPTNVAGFSYAGYTLQCATTLVSTNWTTISPPPVVVNGQNTVTNAISGTQMFYRLSE